MGIVMVKKLLKLFILIYAFIIQILLAQLFFWFKVYEKKAVLTLNTHPIEGQQKETQYPGSHKNSTGKRLRNGEDNKIH